MEKYFLVLDCGATSLRAVAMGEKGEILSIASLPNAPEKQAGTPDYLIWDLEEIWQKLCQSTRQVISQVEGEIAAITVTTFGADGAPIKKDGSLTYPVISWQCNRTLKWVNKITSMIDPREIFRITGYQIIPFNTLLKLLWLRENNPESLDQADTFLMMPGLLSFKLCGEKSIDYSIASTTMMFDVENRTWSQRLLTLAGIDSNFFPSLIQPGEIIGQVTKKASEETGIPTGVPVVASGHDTQFALIGSLASEKELALSSGTWEIAALRIPYYQDSDLAFELGILTELDAEAGLWNPQMLMVAGGVVEWVRRNLFSDLKDRSDIYQIMIKEAQSVSPGAGGATVVPAFMPSGPTKPYQTKGTILGLGLTTDRAQIARATFEGLSFQLRQAMEALQEVYSFRPEAVRAVGGGSKNTLWNQIRADVLNLPVVTTSCQEATVLGATMFSMIGSGMVNSLEEAKQKITLQTQVWEPSSWVSRYQDIFQDYQKLPGYLAPYYRERNSKETL